MHGFCLWELETFLYYFLIREHAPPNFNLKNYLGTNWCGRPMYSEIDVAKAIKL